MDHSSSSQPYHHHAIRVIKPNRHNHPSNNNNYPNDGFDRFQATNNASTAPQRVRPFVPTSFNNNSSPQESSSSTTAAPMPAVKILAKSSKLHIANAASGGGGGGGSPTQAIVSAQPVSAGPIKAPTIVTNRQSSNVRSSNETLNHTSRTTSASTNAKSGSSVNSFSILEKQLARLHIVPSAEVKEKELQLNCTKLLDGEFNLQDSHVVEKLLLTDLQSANSQSTSSTATAASNGQSFCIVGAVGLDGVGKSSLLNTLANQTVFKTHANFATAEATIAPAVGDDNIKSVNNSNNNASSAFRPRDNPLTHVTHGVDLHITSERLFLLDTQPLLSASILDEFLRNSANTQSSYGSSMNHQYHHHYSNHLANGNGSTSLSSVVGFDITEPENFAYIYSMQLLTFMFAICDHLVLVLDSFSFDIYLLKLVATALMMVGDTIPKANLIIYLKPPKSSSKLNTSTVKIKHEDGHNFAGNRHTGSHTQMYELLKNTIVAILGPNVNVEFISDERNLLTTVLKPPSRNLLVTDQQSRPIQYTTERAWFHSVQRFWDTSIRKSTLFVDYARYLP